MQPVDGGDVLTLEPVGDGAYVGRGPRYPWGGLYGGQIVAQALVAAAATTDPVLRPHSLRAYFIRAGDHDEPVRYQVDRLRDGRSFTTRRVVATQDVGVILNLEASFTSPRGDDAVQTSRPPDLAGPDDLLPTSWSPWFDRRDAGLVAGSGRADVWLRWAHPLGDGPSFHEAALAYLSDDVPADAIRSIAPGVDLDTFEEDWAMVSLDHTIWFHEPVHTGQWHLHAFRCDRFVAGRGLAHGHVFTAEGRHVATVAQEMLLRRRSGD